MDLCSYLQRTLGGGHADREIERLTREIDNFNVRLAEQNAAAEKMRRGMLDLEDTSIPLADGSITREDAKRRLKASIGVALRRIRNLRQYATVYERSLRALEDAKLANEMQSTMSDLRSRVSVFKSIDVDNLDEDMNLIAGNVRGVEDNVGDVGFVVENAFGSDVGVDAAYDLFMRGVDSEHAMALDPESGTATAAPSAPAMDRDAAPAFA